MEGHRVNGDQQITLRHALIVGHVNPDDTTGDLWRQRHEVGLHVGVGRIGDERRYKLIQHKDAEDCRYCDADAPAARHVIGGGRRGPATVCMQVPLWQQVVTVVY